MKKSKQNQSIKFLYLFFFGAAMGFLEAIVVVYLRELYYPEGFGFPMKISAPDMVIKELIRELCTLVMLLMIALLSGRTLIQQLSVFLFTFGIWDVFYYIGLKVFLNWPESWFTWDILFLIPVVWMAPVLAPLICSVIMILIALFFVRAEKTGSLTRFHWPESLLILSGSLVIYLSFTRDVGMIIMKGGYLLKLLTPGNDSGFLQVVANYVPTGFHWILFSGGVFLILAGAGSIYFRTLRKFPEN